MTPTEIAKSERRAALKAGRKVLRDAEIERNKKPLASPAQQAAQYPNGGVSRDMDAPVLTEVKTPAAGKAKRSPRSGVDARRLGRPHRDDVRGESDTWLRGELVRVLRDQRYLLTDRDVSDIRALNTIPPSVPLTPSERQLARQLIAGCGDRNRQVPPGLTSTTTPAGIAVHDRDALSPMQTTAPMRTTADVTREKAPAPAAGQVVALGLGLLHPHPDNRHCAMGPELADLADLAESIQQDGQLQPITVRVAPAHWGLPEGHYQIVFGERRWRAAQQAGLQAVQGVIREDLDDAQTLELIAIENGQRKDLNPIEKARLIERLCKPKDQRGSGLTREQAAQRVGLESAAGASNLVRLLELPQVWQDRVAAGELPESFARIVLQYAGAPKLLDRINADYLKSRKDKHDRDWQTRAQLDRHLKWLAREQTRPIDGEKTQYDYSKIGHWGSYPRLFELTDDVRQKLDVRTVLIDGKEVERATNVRLYDKLNIAAIKAKHPQKTAGGTKAKAGKAKSPAAAAKAAAAEKAKARKDLAEEVGLWRHNWLKSLVSERVECDPTLRDMLVLYLLAFDSEAAVFDVWPQRIVAATAKVKVPNEDMWQALLKMQEYVSSIDAILMAVLDRPERYLANPALPTAFLEAIVAEGVGLELEWFELQRNKDKRLAEFFELHAGELLDELGDELGVYLGMAKTKAAKLKLLSAKYPNLPMPKALQPAKPKATKKRGRGK